MSVDLRLGDCMDVMPTLAAGSVDAVITDPPYGVNKDCWDGHIPSGVVWSEVARLLKPGGSLLVFGGLKYMPQVMAAIGKHLDYEWPIAWYKSNAMQFGKTGHSKLSLILWYSKGGAKSVGKMIDVIDYPVMAAENKNGHPTPKPTMVITRLIELVASDTVLDPFMGSGTTGVACMKLGRNFIGIERDEGYFRIAQQRIAEAESQPILFQVPP